MTLKYNKKNMYDVKTRVSEYTNKYNQRLSNSKNKATCKTCYDTWKKQPLNQDIIKWVKLNFENINNEVIFCDCEKWPLLRQELKKEKSRLIKEANYIIADKLLNSKFPIKFINHALSNYRKKEWVERDNTLPAELVGKIELFDWSNIVITGKLWIWKTSLAVSIAKEFHKYLFKKNNFDWGYNNSILIYNDVKLQEILKSFDKDKEIDVIEKASLLIIDDIGVNNYSGTDLAKLWKIIDYRYNNNLKTIITSNLSIKDKMRETLWDRIIERLLSGRTFVLNLDSWVSLRKNEIKEATEVYNI